MAVKLEKVIDALDDYETDYDEAAKLGRGAIPHLALLVEIANPMLASKAAYLASFIQDKRSIAILKRAAQSEYKEVRTAAAAGARNMKATKTARSRKTYTQRRKMESDLANEVLPLLEKDESPGVRKQALKSAKSILGTDTTNSD